MDVPAGSSSSRGTFSSPFSAASIEVLFLSCSSHNKNVLTGRKGHLIQVYARGGWLALWIITHRNYKDIRDESYGVD